MIVCKDIALIMLITLCSVMVVAQPTDTTTMTAMLMPTDIIISVKPTLPTTTTTTTTISALGIYKAITMQMWPAENQENNKIPTTTTTMMTNNGKLQLYTQHNNLSLFMLNDTATQPMPKVKLPAAESEEQLQEAWPGDSIPNMTQNLNQSAEEAGLPFYEYCLLHRNSLADLLTLVLYAIVCLVGLLGNTLVIYVVLRFSKMQTVTNIYILNLAIADECFLIGIPFLLYTMRICSWEFGEWACKAYMVSTSITQFTSSIFLLIMSADRYMAVCHPIVSPRYRTLQNAKWVSTVAWFSSAVLMLPVLLFANTVIQEDGVHVSCNIKWPDAYKRHSGTTFIIYTFALGFATPLCFIMTFYCLVIRKLRRVGPKQRSKEKRRSHRKVTRLVLTVITVYILCWLPHWISQVALISFNPAQHELSRLEFFVFLLLGCLAYSNSAMNPLLYAFLSDNFRKSFSKAFVCMSGRELNAELQVEPSIYTTKNAARKRSMRMPLAATKANTAAGQISFPATTPTKNKTQTNVDCAYDGGGLTTTTNSSGGVSSTMTISSGAQQANGRQAIVQTIVPSPEVSEVRGETLLQTDL